MRYLSVCSGIEAASAAWQPLGWTPVAFSEIEPFPCSALAHHHPGAPNWGDMTKFEEWPDESIDLLCGGTPCQSFSVAGLRKGLADPRGNLMLTFGAIAAKYRPRWMVWENVAGVLSSNGGRDFGSFLGLLGELGYGFAYRVLDAQYVRVQSHPRAVPQRRRRVFVVGHSGGLWQRAAAVLFERESLRGHPAPSRQAGQGVTAGALRSTDGGSDVDHARGNQLVAHSLRGEGFDASEDVSPSLGALNTMAVATQWAVRRLTPLECERIMGFPDGHTSVPHKGKPAADGLRYRALGNSWAINCARWIGERIDAVDAIVTRHSG